MKWTLVLCVGLTASACIWSHLPVTAAEKTFAVPGIPADEATLQERLNQRIDFDVVETPLKDVCEFLRDKSGIQIVLLTKKLEEASISGDSPVTKSLKQVRVKTILDLILKDLELTYLEREGLLLITTPEDAESTMEIRVYDCRDLLAMPAPVGADKLVVPAARPAEPKPVEHFDGYNRRNFESVRALSEHDVRATRLLTLIEANVDSSSWNSVGGPGEISEFNGLVVVTQIAQTHDKVERLLDMLRQAAGLDAAKPGRVVR